MKILVINGPNLNMLGIREPDIYGTGSYKGLCDYVETVCKNHGAECEIFQSNHEGCIVDRIQSAYGKYDAIVINAAAYTHTSIAIADALKAVNIPAVEVHLTNIDSREPYRKISYLREACMAVFSGNGFRSYADAVLLLCNTDLKK